MMGVGVLVVVSSITAPAFDVNAASAGAPLVVAAFVIGFALVRRRRRWRDGIPIAAAPRKAIPDPLSASGVPIEPRMRELELGEEVNMPRWLRPSVRAERFSGERMNVRSAADTPLPEKFDTANNSVDLDALFAARRKAASATARKIRRPRRTAPAE